jgi:hypothetical protein
MMKMTEKTLVSSECDITSTNKETVQDAVEGQRANGAGGLEGGALHVRSQSKYTISLMPFSDTSIPPLR